MSNFMNQKISWFYSGLLIFFQQHMQATCQLKKQLRQLVKKNQNNKQNRHPEIQGKQASLKAWGLWNLMITWT